MDISSYIGSYVINKRGEHGRISSITDRGIIVVEFSDKVLQYESYAFEKGYLTLEDNEEQLNFRVKHAEEELSRIQDEVKSYTDELDQMIGLSDIKEQVERLISEIKVAKLRSAYGLKNPDKTRHMIFLGNPGTGKTTVARTLAKIFKSLGILSKGHMVETDRAGLVAAYEGQTAIKTRKVVESALGGVLFIDEAYSLFKGDNDSYGTEAIDTIVKMVEDHRDDLIVILAGYSKEMSEFMSSNPGLASRFKTTIDFKDYNSDELLDILSYLCAKNDYRLDEEAKTKAREYFKTARCLSGNAREVRNLFEEAIQRQSTRLDGSIINATIDELILIKGQDIRFPTQVLA